jgi:hypothetical protein
MKYRQRTFYTDEQKRHESPATAKAESTVEHPHAESGSLACSPMAGQCLDRTAAMVARSIAKSSIWSTN